MVELLNGEFSTNDTPLAAHLVTEGFPLKDVVMEGRTANFIFSNDDPTFHEAIRAFGMLNATSSNAAQLIENFRQLITRAKRGY